VLKRGLGSDSMALMDWRDSPIQRIEKESLRVEQKRSLPRTVMWIIGERDW
jgi:hypothetical protein